MFKAPIELLRMIHLFFLFFLFFSIKGYADVNTDCYASINSQKVYKLNYTLKVDNITSSTPNGALIGTVLAKNTNFTCNPVHNYKWGLQVSPNAIANLGTPSICRTNIVGIGIQYLNYLGQPINCNAWDEILQIKSNQKSGNLSEGTVLARIIKIDGHLSNGQYPLKITSTLISYFNGLTTSTPWGNFLLQGNGDITFSQYQPQIFFPSSPRSTPIIDLNVNNNLHGRNASGKQQSTTLDMCLYDGNSSTSKGLKLIFNDNVSVATGRSPGFFSIFRNGGDRSKIQDRLDYAVSIVNPITGSRQEVKNGIEIYWSGVNARRILRQVVLPDVPGVSLCVPAPVTFSTPSLDISGKSAGNYSGILTVTYSPST